MSQPPDTEARARDYSAWMAGDRGQHASLLVWEFKGNLSVIVCLPGCDDCHVNKEREHLKNFNFNSVNWLSWMLTLNAHYYHRHYLHHCPREVCSLKWQSWTGKKSRGAREATSGLISVCSSPSDSDNTAFLRLPLLSLSPPYCPLTEVSPDPCFISSSKWLPLQQTLLSGVDEIEFFFRRLSI